MRKQTYIKKGISALIALLLGMGLYLPSGGSAVSFAPAVSAAPAVYGANEAAQEEIMSRWAPLTGNAAQTNQFTSKTVPGSWFDYLHGEWMKCRSDFKWSDTSGIVIYSFDGTKTGTGLPKWNGQPANLVTSDQPAPSLPGNESMIPFLTAGNVWEVWTGEQLRYAFEKAVDNQTIKLMRDIDLAGYDNNWSYIKITRTGLNFDGNYHTIHNLGMTNSLFYQQLTGAWMKNVTFKSVKSVTDYVPGSVDLPVGLFVRFSKMQITNVRITDSLYFNASRGDNYTSPLEAKRAFDDVPGGSTFDNIGIEQTYCYGYNHVGGAFALPSYETIKNSYAVDGVVVSVGGHSGGFSSCCDYNETYINCFTNNKVFGTSVTGGFEGYAGSASYTNCYSAGSVEGYDVLGGFIGRLGSTSGFPLSHVYNCYSSTIVGMQKGGIKQGGFAGVVNAQVTLRNCYAAGEVGALGTEVTLDRTTYKDVGGFVGDSENKKIGLYTACYYDKQTTAMRECGYGTQMSGLLPGAVIPGLKGVLTTDANKNGTLYNGLTGNPGTFGFSGFQTDTPNEWISTDDGRYPQLTAFTNPVTFSAPVQSLVRAYSLASVSTVHLSVWEKDYAGNNLPDTVYDTVRDITIKFALTSQPDTSWTQGGATSRLYDPSEALPVLQLSYSGGKWQADKFVPGIEWLTVYASAGGATGNRRLRLIPTMNLTAGKSKYITATSFYDHADDVRMEYSTGVRLAQTPTSLSMGVYPDSPLNDYQKIVQGQTEPANFALEDDKFTSVGLSHMASGSSMETVISRVASIDSATYIVTAGAELPLRNSPDAAVADKWNGHTAFEQGDSDRYLIEYYWNLSDGRYLHDAKMITVVGTVPSLTVKVINEDGSPNPAALEIDASADTSDRVLANGRAEDAITVDYGTPSLASWKIVNPDTTSIVGFFISSKFYESYDDYDKTWYGSLDGKSFTVPYAYRDLVYTENGYTYAPEYTASKTYTINKDQDDLYTMAFNHSVTTPSGAVYPDMERCFEITLVVKCQPVVYLRQVVLDSKDTLAVPDTAYVSMLSHTKNQPSQITSVINARANSAAGLNPTLYEEVSYTRVGLRLKSGAQLLTLRDTVPMNYRLVRTETGLTSATQTPSEDAVLDYSVATCYYVTFYIEPSSKNPELPYSRSSVRNEMGRLAEVPPPPIAE